MSSDCNSDIVNPLCSCGTKFSSSDSQKIYDFKSDRFFCCGNLPYNTNIVGTNPIAVAASLDYPQCTNWWNSAVIPAEQFSYVSNAGPTTARLNALTAQTNLSAAFPLANINSGIEGANYSCEGVVGSLNDFPTVPRMITYANPNSSGPNYVSNSPVICVGYDTLLGAPNPPFGWLSSTTIGQTGNFAINNISQCSSGDLSNPVCTPSTSLTNITPGTQVFAAANYNGGGGGGGGGGCCGSSWWIWLIVAITIIIILIFIFTAVYYAIRTPKPVHVTANGTVIATPVYTTPTVQQTTIPSVQQVTTPVYTTAPASVPGYGPVLTTQPATTTVPTTQQITQAPTIVR